MSKSRKNSKEMGYENLNDRFRNSSFDLGSRSPVSPLPANGGAIPTPTSSSSTSSSGNPSSPQCQKRSDHSGELSVCSETSPNHGFSHRRSISGSTQTQFSQSRTNASRSNGDCVNSSIAPRLLPTGNICPSGKIVIANQSSSPRREILGSGRVNYGHGSIMRGSSSSSSSSFDGKSGPSRKVIDSATVEKALTSWDLEVVKEAGNDQHKEKNFSLALSLYDRAITISPTNAVCRSNRAAALICLGRLPEAVTECEEAVRLDPKYERAHQRLSSLYLRLGQVENARKHVSFAGKKADSGELLKLQQVEKHLTSCFDARRVSNWHKAMREGNAAIEAGADYSPQLFACRAEANLKLGQILKADFIISNIPKFEPYPPSCAKTSFFGMLSEAYVLYVRAQVEMALGRFDNAVAAAEKAGKIEPKNMEVAKILANVQLVKRASDRGNDLFNDNKFIEAASAYWEGLKLDPFNSVLYCNRGDCWFNLGQWEKSIEDCNKAIEIQPTYTKALHQRAQSYGKLESRGISVRDYEPLRTESPRNNEVAKVLTHAQIALESARGEVEEVADLDRYRAAISSSRVVVVYFKAAANQQCKQISPHVDMLCVRCPSVTFLKVDVERNVGIANVANVMTVPTFSIYKNGRRVMEMIDPGPTVLESSVKGYCL